MISTDNSACIRRAALALLCAAAPIGAQGAPRRPAPAASTARTADVAFDSLASQFWQWRAVHQPITSDDIPRILRGSEWVPALSPASFALKVRALRDFQRQWRAIDTTRWSVSRQVDYRLIGSAIHRVEWELLRLRNHERNALFWVENTLGMVHDRLVVPPPFDDERTRELVLRLEAIPGIVADAKRSLSGPVPAIAPFARAAIAALSDVRDQLTTMARELEPFVTGTDVARIPPAADSAALALVEFRAWLQRRLPSMATRTAVGVAQYQWFLDNVALVPFTPAQLAAMGRQEWSRAVSFEAYERLRNRARPELPLFPSAQAQIARQRQQEEEIRRFLDEGELLTIPAGTGHYLNRLAPPYLRPLMGFGLNADHTDAARLGENGTAWILEPSATLPYFPLSMARDPRPIIVHEGVPGHFFQLTLGLRHENPIRRHYYDSGANEGIGYYAEEMMLQSGLWDDSPKSREIIYNYMRLRALRVEVDVKLAIGEFTIPQAGEYLRSKVPMDSATAHEEAAMFAATPGQAITYTIGKLQILGLLADARERQGEKFSVRAFHDFVWKNGNVPIALQRWELLGLTDEVRRLGRERR